LNTWAAFAGSPGDVQIAEGVAMKEDEVQEVLKALRGHGMNVAIHHHVIGTQPTITFLQYWGRGPAEKPAEGFRAALDQLGR